MFTEFIALELSCVYGLMCQLHATVMRMIPTVYGPPRHNMVHLVNFKWIYMRLSFSACSVEKALMILSGIHIHAHTTEAEQLFLYYNSLGVSIHFHLAEPKVLA